VTQVYLGVSLYQQRQDSSQAEARSATAEARADEFSKCTAKWQDDFLAAYRARSDASYVVNQALDRLILAVAHEDQDAFQAALRNYVAVRDQQAQQREDHPLPPLPSTRCGTG
jgi:Flp pilus assembly protein CpaB